MTRSAIPYLFAVASFVVSAATSHAQPVYRVVGPDGKVTFSDRAPPAGSTAPATGTATPSAGGDASTLPYELRQVAARYPVVLYTAADCGPCASARLLLQQRGVPFSERTISTAGDSQALQKISGGTTMPFGTIGSQHLVGFADAEWTQYLDAAGYPKQSTLPASFKPSAPQPMVAVKAAPAASTTALATPVAADKTPAPRRLPASSPSNPKGIQF